MNNTTRKYPRTLQQAFPQDRKHAEWLTRYPRTDWGERVLAWFLCLVLGVGLAAWLVVWWSS